VFERGYAECDVKVALSQARSIVHLKCFYLMFARVGRQKSPKVRRLLFGSANATDAAFSGQRNAELLARMELQENLHADLVKRLRGRTEYQDVEGYFR